MLRPVPKRPRASLLRLPGWRQNGGTRRIHHLDEKWLNKWTGPYGPPTTATTPQYYQLAMIPYPSGRLHIGHLRVYAISDTLARFRRMSGWRVVHPAGWDAFGLPAENAAIEHGASARQWTYDHIEAMRAQIKRMLISLDWEDEIITCDPRYYQHTQAIFLQLFEHNLAYRAKASVNWDPVDQTVLANEQIDSEGRSWRSGAVAEQRELEQWFLRITAFAPELLAGLDQLSEWPEMVKSMQRNWIGMSVGAKVRFGADLWAYTTKIETLPGVKFVAVAVDHPLAKQHSASTHPNGLIEGVEAVHPLSGEPLPVYAAEYVVGDYAEGVVMGVPAHDERDRNFWENVKPANDVASSQVEEIMADGKVVAGPYTGLSIEDARSAILRDLEAAGTGHAHRQFRLRDWLVSRQRFWGAPIPIVHCDSCGVVPVPHEDLPVELPQDTKNVPLSQNAEWLATECPKCGGPAKRDPDTMDTFMDSSWYFFRSLDAHNATKPFDKAKVTRGMPVDFYLGGIEHAILHLLYSRFLSRFLAKDGRWDSKNDGEPFKRLVTLGMVHGKAFRDRKSGRYLKPHEVAAAEPKELVESMEKMSKSKHNGTDPLAVIEVHGADAVRAHMLFQAPVTDTLMWDTEKIVGVERWLRKVEYLGAKLAERLSENAQNAISQNGNSHRANSHSANSHSAHAETRSARSANSARSAQLWNQSVTLLNRITDSLGNTLALNTVVSDQMKLLKLATDLAEVDIERATHVYTALLKVLAPVCPATADERWEAFCRATNTEWTSIHAQRWPELAPISVESADAEFKVIVDGKTQKVRAPANATQHDVLMAAGLANKTLKMAVFKPQIKLLSVKLG